MAITAFGRSSGLFGEDLQNYNGIGINTVDQTPMSTAVIDFAVHGILRQFSASGEIEASTAIHRAEAFAVGTRLRGAPSWKTEGS